LTKEITVEQTGGLAIVSLNRPDKLNALTLEMRAELLNLFRRLDSDTSVRAVLLRAEGRAFCAGADVTSMGKDDIVGDRNRVLRAHQMILAIHNINKPVICALRGAAVGIGLSIALACDVIIASETAKLALVFKKVGLAMDGGAAYFLSNLIGRQRTIDLAYSARTVRADEALTLGLVSQVHGDDVMEDAAASYAADLASGPTFAFAANKRMLRLGQSPSLEAFLDVEIMAQGQVIKSRDHVEGIASFLEKRPPKFQGV